MAVAAAGPRRKKKAAPSHCSPARFGTKAVTGTCLSRQEIAAVAKVVGVRPPGGGGGLGALLRRLHDVIGTRPGEEERWANALLLRPLQSTLSAAFRPAHPAEWTRNPRFWLSDLDINRVMRQYEHSHGDRFKFVGVFPRDFAKRDVLRRCVSADMCALSAASVLAEGRSEFGVVFNMDDHTQRGSHWTALYCCLNPQRRNRYGIWYYDSVAKPPPKEIQAFMQRIVAEVGAPRFSGHVNTVRRQFENTECGVYSMFFIVACITTGRSFQDLCENLMRDDDAMQKLRAVFFRPPPEAFSNAARRR